MIQIGHKWKLLISQKKLLFFHRNIFENVYNDLLHKIKKEIMVIECFMYIIFLNKYRIQLAFLIIFIFH